ncbi:type II secretion system protein GspG [Candidatus Babeliales bacterium]|nr:type II secretion system protein GspG [Candidatus Babeliales bacterium]MBP9844166.1 type II secretion system protein GspG [Candidatus Babeliales bacterium]
MKTMQKGFSVIELMISLAIIMLIMSMVAPGLLKILNKGDRAATQNTLKLVDNAILEYKSDVHQLPEKLEDLDKRPEGVTGWNGSYLPDKMQGKEVLDNWGEPIIYKKLARGSAKPYELYSMGDPTKEEDRIDA